MRIQLFAIVTVFLCVWPASSFAQANLYPDSVSGLEIDFWWGSNPEPASAYDVGIETEKVFEGKRALKFHCPDASVPTGGHATAVVGGTNSSFQSGNIAVSEGNYIFSARIYIEGTAPANVVVYLTEKSVTITDGLTLTIALSGVVTDSWQTISKKVTFPSAIPEMKTGIRVRGMDYAGKSGASTLYFDKMTLVAEGAVQEDTIYSPILDSAISWEINADFSDEFYNPEIDLQKWDTDVSDWGTWSWEPENACVKDSVLSLTMQHKQHTRGGNEYYFTSGISRNKKTITYGYFEARIKATAKGQGTCPAFWLYSVGQPEPEEEGGVQYSEIDVVEIFQIPNKLQQLEMNLHTRIMENGVMVWKRPGQGDIELCHNTWAAPWDPRDDYHTYAVWNRLDSIFWYVDGIQRGAKKNYYWHLPMYVTVSLGLRTPYEKYIDGVRTPVPYPDSVPEPGFPTEMYCDYVRVWNTPPQIYAEVENYKNKEFSNQNNLEFECRYFAGNGDIVLAENELNGVSCLLQEVDGDGRVVGEIAASDSLTLGKESGKALIAIDLSQVDPSFSLPQGHRYVLKPFLKSTFKGGTEVILPEKIIPVTIVGKMVGMEELNQDSDIKVYPNPALNRVNISSIRANEISIYNLAGELVKQKRKLAEPLEVDLTGIKTGLYIIRIQTDKETVNKKLQIVK